MRVLLVVLLVALAGCSGFSGAPLEEPTETVTPVPEYTPAPSYPPGMADTGVVDPDVAASAHVDRLSETSYTLTSNRTVRTDGSLRSFLSVRVAVDADRRYHARAQTDGPEGPEFLGRPPAMAEFWSDGDRHLRMLTRDGTTTYDELESGPGRVSSWRYWTRTAAFGDRGGSVFLAVRDILASFDWQIQSESSDNATRYRLEADEYTSTAFTASEIDSVRSATATARVTDSGLVRSIHLQYVGTVEGEDVVVERTIEYDDVGTTTVERPSWYDRAVD